MAKILGYMISFTKYGTWLQGDERGYVKDAIIRPENERLKQANKQSQVQDAVRLSETQQKAVCEAILKEASLHDQRIFALAARPTHVHFVAKYIPVPISRVVAWYKSAARLVLKNSGHKGKLWTRGYNKKFCFDQATLEQKIKYVQNHNPT
jgi:REP element-mobilizing transposase RayT